MDLWFQGGLLLSFRTTDSSSLQPSSSFPTLFVLGLKISVDIAHPAGHITAN